MKKTTKRQNLENRKRISKVEKSNNIIQNVAKYTSLSFQMLAVILIFVYGGKKLDECVKWQTPIFTLIMSLVGVVLAIYVAIKDFLKKK